MNDNLPAMHMEIATYNQLPANCRRTVNGEHHALVNNKEWRKVVWWRKPRAVSAPKTAVAVPA